MLLYLHGFRSSPKSAKATQMAARMRELGLLEHFHCPQLPASPKAAMALARSFAPGPADTIVGSSLGGFYATFLAGETGSRCVLLNPSIDPVSGAPRFVGTHTMYHSDDPFEFRAEYVDELRQFYAGPIPDPARCFLVAAKGDELLDWREMVARYPGARHRVLEGSDHGMVDDFPAFIDEVLVFAGLISPPRKEKDMQ